MATYTPYPGAVERLLASEQIGAAMERRALRGKAFAESIAPERTGRYRWGTVRFNKAGGAVIARNRHKRRPTRSRVVVAGGGGFHVVRFRTAKGYAGARLINTTPYAVWIEFGTRYMKAQRILGRAMDAMR